MNIIYIIKDILIIGYRILSYIEIKKKNKSKKFIGYVKFVII